MELNSVIPHFKKIALDMFKLLQRILAAPVLWETGECKSMIYLLLLFPVFSVVGSAGNVCVTCCFGEEARRCGPEFIIPALLCFLCGGFLRESSFGRVRSG